MKPRPIPKTPRESLRVRLGLPKEEPRRAPNREPMQVKDMTPKERNDLRARIARGKALFEARERLKAEQVARARTK